MGEINGVAIELGRVLKGETIIILTVSVVVWLQGVDVLIQDLEGTELLVSAEG